jgi:glutamine amidotransferase
VIAVIDYGIGNLRSAEKAMQRVGATARLVADPEDLAGASGIVLPGVGSFGRCADALTNGGWRAPIEGCVAAGTPFLGICVGFQLLYESSEESPGAAGLGLIPGTVRRLPDDVKHPQIQWNRLDVMAPNDLIDSEAETWMYFVHSFAPEVGPETVATCDYGGPVAAAVQVGSLFGVQFHPEKSGEDGLSLLRRFAEHVEGRS